MIGYSYMPNVSQYAIQIKSLKIYRIHNQITASIIQYLIKEVNCHIVIQMLYLNLDWI